MVPIRNRLWALILAGGDGTRLRPLVERVCGDLRPRQFAPLMGGKSLLRQTLDRARLTIGPEHTVVVGTERHVAHLAAETRDFTGTVLVQPSNRGTSAGLLWPIYWIHRFDPEALVVVLPSDHYVLEERLFMAHVSGVAGFVRENPQWLVGVGARPTQADPDCGWVERSESLGGSRSDTIWRVSRLWNKLTPDQAHSAFARGHLWNTFVLVGRVETFVNAARLSLPELHLALSDAVRAAGTEGEREALETAYERLPVTSFSDAVLASPFPRLATSCLPPLLWSDLGTPERLVRTATLLSLKKAQGEPSPAIPEIPAPLLEGDRRALEISR